MTEGLEHITFLVLITLIISGFFFGIFFTYTHFLALKYYVFKQKHIKTSLFVLTFVRLFICGLVLWIILNIHQSVADVLIFFAAFMVARWLTFFKTKRMLANGKNI